MRTTETILHKKTKTRLVKKIERSRRDRKSNGGDFLIFVFLVLVKWSEARSEKPAN